jgi:hypothetical protein
MSLLSLIKLATQTGEVTTTGCTETWIYQAKYDSCKVTPYMVATASITTGGVTVSIPVVGSIHPSGVMFCRSVAPVQTQNANIWNVTVRWDTVVAIGKEKKPEGTDVVWNVEWNEGPGEYQEPAQCDALTGAAIVNSAKQAFTNTPSKTFYTRVFNMSFYTDFPNNTLATAIDGAIGKVNSAACTLTYKGRTIACPRGTLLFKAYTMAYRIEQGIDCQVCSYTFEKLSQKKFSAPNQGGEIGWAVQVLDSGYNELINGKLTPIRDDDIGRPVNGGFFLDGNGHKSATATPVWLAFYLQSETNFSALFAGQSTVTCT